MITASQLRSQVLRDVNRELNPIGFKSYKDYDAYTYCIYSKDYIFSFSLRFLTYGVEFRYLSVTIKAVENILKMLGQDNEVPWAERMIFDDNYCVTISDKNKGRGEIFRTIDIYSLDEVEPLSHEIIVHIRNMFDTFIKHNLSYPNIVRRLDELENHGIYWQDSINGILQGRLEAEFRGLIISKLCNDPNYENKVRTVNKTFYEDYPDRTEYHPYYERLKKILETLEPVCSMDAPNPFENVDMIEYLRQQHYEYQAMIDKDKTKKKSSDEVLTPEKATKLFKSKIKESLDIQAFKRATKRDIPSITVYGKEQCYGVATFSFETTDKGNIIPHPISIYLAELEEIMEQIDYPGKDIPREGIPYTQKDELSPEILDYLEKEPTPPTEDSITELAELVSDYIDNSEDYVTYNADILNLYEEAHGEGFWFEYLYGNSTEEKLLRAVTYLVLSGNTDCLQDELPNYKILLTGDWDTSLHQLRQVLADRGYEVWED